MASIVVCPGDCADRDTHKRLLQLAERYENFVQHPTSGRSPLSVQQ